MTLTIEGQAVEDDLCREALLKVVLASSQLVMELTWVVILFYKGSLMNLYFVPFLAPI